MNTPHTPGPWKPFTRYVSANGRFLAKAFEANDATETPGFISQQEPQQSQAEAVANARLIAAAPELLSALVTLLHHADLGEIHDEETAVAVNNARAAIAKATGNASPAVFNC